MARKTTDFTIVPKPVAHLRKKRLRNPKFRQESLTGLSWTRVVGGEFPHNRTTICCGAKARPQEIVISIPFVVKKECVGTSIIHASCMRELIQQVPEDLSVSRDKARQIVEMFIEEKSDDH